VGSRRGDSNPGPPLYESERRSYVVGFYHHDRRERCRTFPSVRHARAWMDDYITAERRGRESLRRFLLDLDAKETNELEARTIGQLLELYLKVNAHPSNPGGLAPSTYERYESLIGLHMLDKPRRRVFGMGQPRSYAVAFCSIPAVRFNEPQAPAAWREQMLREGVPKGTRKQAWRVLSAALSWAASSNLVGEIRTNGCSFAPEPRGNIRRSLRCGGTGYEPGPRRHGLLVPVGTLAPGGRGDPRTDARPHRGTQGDPRSTRRDDRQPAVRAVRAKPGGSGGCAGHR
jgi:hypothetical protein